MQTQSSQRLGGCGCGCGGSGGGTGHGSHSSQGLSSQGLSSQGLSSHGLFSHSHDSACSDHGAHHLERLNYFDRMLLTPDDLRAEQEYFLAKLMQHNRLVHGWGVVCGLEVSADPTEEQPWRVCVGPGYALDPFGREIYVSETACLDLALCAGGPDDPCDPGYGPHATTGGEIFVAIRYRECAARPVRALAADDLCEQACEYSRFREGFELACLDDLPPTHEPGPGASLCEVVHGEVLSCPPCPDDPWLVLARVTLPAALVELGESDLDSFTDRRLLFSTGSLQEQLIACCCESPEQPSPEQPSPEQPSPEQPSPEQTSPEQPSPEQPIVRRR